MNYSELLNNYIVRNNLKQREMAKLLGVSESTVSSWLRGDFPPNKTNLEKIKQFFKEHGEQQQLSLYDEINNLLDDTLKNNSTASIDSYKKEYINNLAKHILNINDLEEIKRVSEEITKIAS